MIPPETSRHRPRHLAIAALLTFAAGVLLRVGAHPWCTHLYHVTYTPGSDLNGEYTNVPLFNALVEIARVLLGLGTALFTLAATAWLFVPTSHRPLTADPSTSTPAA